jgi:hypothetical protein
MLHIDIGNTAKIIVHFLIWVQRKFSCDVTVMILSDTGKTTFNVITCLALNYRPFLQIPPVSWQQIVRVCDCIYDLDQSIRYRKARMCSDYDNLIGVNARTGFLYRNMFYRTCNINKPSLRQYVLLPATKRALLLEYLSKELIPLEPF